MRARPAACLALVAVALAGCGGGGDDDTASTTASTTTTASTATTATGTTATTAGGGGPPAATAAERDAIPAGLVPAAPSDRAEDPAAVAEVRARLGRSSAAVRAAGGARFTLKLQVGTADTTGSGQADFRRQSTLLRQSVRTGGRTIHIDQYHDGTTSFSRPRIAGSARWMRDAPSPVPNAPGNSTGLFASQVRVGSAGAEATIEGLRCRWAAGVVPLRELLEAAGATDDPAVEALLAQAKRGAVYPIGACVAEDGRIARLRYDVRFDRDLGLTGAAGQQTIIGDITYSDYGKAPAVKRPADLPRSLG